jgi:phosphoribosyl-AMP cyclohydrolase / phosphoribosyl-ATP pyrophosphohydrolase
MNASPDFARSNGLLPAIIQHATDHRVLMLGWMNSEALARTRATGRVTFWSRSRQSLWTKGETSGHYLEVVDIAVDCDADTVLVRALPHGPTCHTGTASCFGDAATATEPRFLDALESLIAASPQSRRPDSYTTKLLSAGTATAAQKVGEEAVEVALAAVTRDDAGLLDESADLLFHLLVLLRTRALDLRQVEAVLQRRHANPAAPK